MQLGFFLILIFWLQPSQLDILAQAEASYRLGEYVQAADLARRPDDADGYALAARSNLVIAAYKSVDYQNALMALDQAMADAEKSRAIDSSHIEGRLQAAIAMGYKARIERSTTLARDARTLMESVLRDDPVNPYALASLGGWHGESIRTVGAFLAALSIGATKRDFTKYFEAALEQDPLNPAIRVYYARLLLDIGGRRYTMRGLEVLKEAAGLMPRDAFEMLMLDHGRQLQEVAEKGNKDELDTVLSALTPFANP